MSVKVMSMVFEHYPEGGSEMLLALALADFSNDDGTSIYPSVIALAKKTRQSERSVQYQIQKMTSKGFLSLVEAGGRDGKKYRANEYRINFDFFNKITTATKSSIVRGATSAPLPSTPDVTGDTSRGAEVAPLNQSENVGGEEGCNPVRLGVQSDALGGAIAVAPHTPYTTTITTTTTNTRAGDPELPTPKTVVVVNDLIFPPGIPPDQQDAIRSILFSSLVAAANWQAILDELAGAQLHGLKMANPISNPAGYVRGIAKRAADGTFVPERGLAVASRRELHDNLERQDALRIASVPKLVTTEAQLASLPDNLRGSLSRIRANKPKGASGA